MQHPRAQFLEPMRRAQIVAGLRNLAALQFEHAPDVMLQAAIFSPREAAGENGVLVFFLPPLGFGKSSQYPAKAPETYLMN